MRFNDKTTRRGLLTSIFGGAAATAALHPMMLAAAPRARSEPTKELPAGIVTVPNTSTDYTTKTTFVHQIIASNKSASAVTFTVTDKQSSPKTLVPTVTINANSQYSFWCSDGVCLLNGMTWACSAAGALDAEVYGYVAGALDAEVYGYVAG